MKNGYESGHATLITPFEFVVAVTVLCIFWKYTVLLVWSLHFKIGGYSCWYLLIV